ncbi:MAG: DoxX family protein [Afipia sp.]|jgi:putative oxidoreductase|nr:DoxX family protein [Afipia sp.]
MNDTFLAAYRPQLLSLLRIVTGLLLFHYGIAKILKFPVVPMFANLPPLIQVAGYLELILGALLLIGLFSRLAAFVLSGEMAAAYFMGHMMKNPDPVLYPALNGGTAAIMLCFVCLYIAAAGPGPWSVDAAMRGKS